MSTFAYVRQYLGQGCNDATIVLARCEISCQDYRPSAASCASIRNWVLLSCLSSPEQKQEYVENKIKIYHEKNNDSATAQGRQYITISIIYDTLVFARLFLKKLRGGKINGDCWVGLGLWLSTLFFFKNFVSDLPALFITVL
jgi:hypothetical protein